MKPFNIGMLALALLAVGLIAGPVMALVTLGLSVCALGASEYLPPSEITPRSIFETRRAGLA